VSGDSILVNAGSAVPAWHTTQPLNHARMVANAVLAPNGDIVLMGGCSQYYPGVLWGQWTGIVKQTEVWDRVMGWQPDATQDAPRMYHSTAALLPSGRMVSAGGDYRLNTSNVSIDWEIYVPRYLAVGQPKPQFAGSWANPGFQQLSWGSQYVVDHVPMEGAIAVSHVVLMRPCSTTHHSDMDQKYIELPSVPVDDGNAVVITMPAAPPAQHSGVTLPQGSIALLPGFYMMFLVTTKGTPSQAKWVRLL
jgi:hypothetical protein